jgi:hypothetical protein
MGRDPLFQLDDAEALRLGTGRRRLGLFFTMGFHENVLCEVEIN